jgi:hypothetical protein
MADSKPAPDRDLEQPKPPTPTGNKSKDGETLDSLLSHIPPVKREF